MAFWARLLASCLWCVLIAAAATARPAGSAARIVQVNGYPEFQVDGRPFFVYGAAFFYERIPRDQWEADLRALRGLGINTIDLYVIWNWHETDDGVFDFDGHTNGRRDLRGLLRLLKALDFQVIVRPGPVIRNEWRNGGYPAWLLSRPEYGMPLHDLLEGRYPPTATLQNAHSDDAAAQWMRNATHLKYAQRWLEHALQEVAGSGVSVAAVALDDDQGAYLGNQTWPAPHLAAYLKWLGSVAHSFTSSPLFINTYEMTVTASSPYWAMGDWYQSDAYALGEHDRGELEFSTGLLQTQTRGPVMLSEFQAGWLEQPGDVLPRRSAPSNTLLAAHTLLGMGLRGLVNFPAQDTTYPAGWEAPFANSFYAWDAALQPDRTTQPRAEPTKRVGDLVGVFGRLLAATHVAADAAIAYTTSAYEPVAVSSDALDAIVGRTKQAQRICRSASVACDLVDLRFADSGTLRRYPVLFVPIASDAFSLDRMVARVDATIKAYQHAGGVVIAYRGDLTRAAIDRALMAAHQQRSVDALPGATLLQSDETGGGEFFVAENYSAEQTMAVRGVTVAGSDGNTRVANTPVAGTRAAAAGDKGATVHLRAAGGTRFSLPSFQLQPRDAVVIPLDVPLRALSSAFAPRDRLVVSTCLFSWAQAERNGVTLRVADGAASCIVRFRVSGRDVPVAVSTTPASIVLGASGSVRLDTSRPPPVIEKPQPPRGPTLPARYDVRIPTVVSAPHTGGDLSITEIDAYDDGYFVDVLQNDLVRLIVSPSAGGRAFVFEDIATHGSVFTTVGALRDDVLLQPPPSPTDRIAAYTHQFPAGTFNRVYSTPLTAVNANTAKLELAYDAPDVVPKGAHFDRTISLAAHSRAFMVEEQATFDGDDAQGKAQRAVSITSLAVGDPRDMSTQYVLMPETIHFSAGSTFEVTSGDAIGFYDTRTRQLATIAWRSGDVEKAQVETRPDSIVSKLVFAPGRITRTLYGYDYAANLAAAVERLKTADEAAQTR